MITGVVRLRASSSTAVIWRSRSAVVSWSVRCTAYTVTPRPPTSTVATSTTLCAMLASAGGLGSGSTCASSSGARDRIATPSVPSPVVDLGSYAA